jgi:uncharacterized membrane protein
LKIEKHYFTGKQSSMKKFILLSSICLSFALIIFSCSRKSAATIASNKQAAHVTMYETSVKPLIATKCAPCHFPAEGGKKKALDNYDSVKVVAADIVRRIELNAGDKGFMPFKKTKLSAEEIAVFKKWVEEETK